MGKITPLYARAMDVEDGIDNRADVPRTWSACFGLRKKILYPFRLVVAQVARVGLPHD